jgi:uncharacterized protein
MMHKKFFLTAGFLLLAAFPARAQQTSGTYTMSVVGKAVSVENYTLISELDGALRAEAEISASGSKQKTMTSLSKGRPVSFLAQAGETKLISAAFDRSGVKLQIAGQAERQLTTKATVILENAVWHHFIFLFNQYDAQKGGSQSFSALLPSRAMDFDVQVERTATPTFEIGGKQVATERYVIVSSSGLILDAWTDFSRTPLLILLEAQGVKVIRQGSEQLAEAVSKPIVTEGYLSEEVMFQNGDVSLSGTLTIPRAADEQRHQVALLISGSGSQDRDGNPGVFSFYKLIAEKLSVNGMAVLRHDDRGVGKSAMPKTPTSYRDLINDSKAAVQYLRSRSDIDPDRIALIGHSEGGTTATIIASEDSKIAAIVLLAGAIGVNLEQVLLEQTIYKQALERLTNPQDRGKYPQIVRWLMTQIGEAKAGKADSAPTDLREYIRQHLALNQAEIYKRVQCPALILQGERDSLVLAHHAVAAARALADAGNKQVSVRIFPNLSHIFTPSPLDRSLPAEKKNEISPEELETVQKWVVEVVIGDKENRTGK